MVEIAGWNKVTKLCACKKYPDDFLQFDNFCMRMFAIIHCFTVLGHPASAYKFHLEDKG